MLSRIVVACYKVHWRCATVVAKRLKGTNRVVLGR